ncbi:hypothetical protein LC55x_1638 [Lysobacter capsici]|nr:hypothetical protein LC55x_1638 [Lysobacter capsici]
MHAVDALEAVGLAQARQEEASGADDLGNRADGAELRTCRQVIQA